MEEENLLAELNNLIDEGKEIKKHIKYVPSPENVWRTYSVYKFQDYQLFEIWKSKSIRLLSREFKGDRCIKDFEEVIKEMKYTKYPSDLDKLIGILKACTFISKIENEQESNDNNISPIININNTQNQTQSQMIAVNIFVDAIRDELTGNQIKEIQAIFEQVDNPIDSKKKIIEKLKSFGENVLTNIIANIITNPSVWGQF